MRTIVFSYLITDIICVWFVVQLWRQNRNRFAGTAFWVFDFIFQAAALFLIVMRGTIPDWTSMVLSNTLVIVGAILGFVGQERFLAKKGPQIQNYLLVILFIIIHSYFSLIQPNLAVRTLNIAVALLLVCLQSVWLMWHRVEPRRRSLTFGVGMVNFLYCLVSVVRIAHFFVIPHLDESYFKPVFFEALMLLAYQVLFILLTYSFVLMVNKRLIMEVGTQEEKFSKAFHSAPYAITITRPSDGKIIEVNEKFSAISGYGRNEVLSNSVIALHLWERDEDRAAMVDVLSRTGNFHEKEVRFRGKSGKDIVGLFSAEILPIDGENFILSSIADITERKQMEEELFKSRERLLLATKATNTGIWDWDVVNNNLIWDDSMYTLYGIRKEDFGGVYEAWSSMVPDEDRQYAEAEIQAALRGEREYDIVHRIVRPDGEVRFIKVGSKTYFDESGKPLRMIGTNIDITKSKQAEETLKEEHRRLQQALDEVRTLRGIMPICAYCKKIRDDDGYWNQVEKYVSDHTEATFSHGICPACFEKEMKGIEASS
jgi:PAS domain S-box-containing protein